MLSPMLSEKKLSVQVVGSSEPGEEKDKNDNDDMKDTVLKFHDGDNMVSQPDKWKTSLKLNPVLFITK